MTKRYCSLALVCATVSLFAGCSRAEQEPRAERTYRTFKQIAAATSIGVNKLSYDNLLQAAAGEVLILVDLASGTKDTVAVKFYRAALSKYQDAGTLWSTQIENARYDFLPKDRIDIADSTFAKKYGLPVTVFTAPYGASKYVMVPKESIQRIWELARVDADSADGLVLGSIREAHR